MNLSKHAFLETLGANIAAIRKSKNLTLRELSERSSVDFSAIGKIEKGKTNVSVLTLVDLASGLGVQPKKLLDFRVGQAGATRQ